MKRIVGGLGWLGVLLVTAAVVLRFTRPELSEWYRGLALGGLVVTGAYALSQWRDIGRSFQGRSVKYGSIAASSVVLVLAILVGVNWISSRQNKRWDFTSNASFSLSDQTRQILRNLKQPVVIRVFYQGQSAEYRDRLSAYTYESSQVSAEYTDAVANPLAAQKFNISTVPTFLIEYQGRTERADAADEQTLTNALKRVIEGKPKTIYFVQGHGEHDPSMSDPSGYSGIAEALKNDNFEVASLVLAQTQSVPDEATLVVIAGPRTDLLAQEAAALRAFLARGGKLALLIDPPDKGAATPLPNLLSLAQEWGADVGNNLVVDASGLGQYIGTGPEVPIAMPVAHAITQNFRLMTAFPLARSVSPNQAGASGRTAQTILQTRPESWAESDIAGLYATGKPERNLDRGDLNGPISIAVVSSAPATQSSAEAPPDAPKLETRVAVFGDSDFASNQTIAVPGNRDIFLNTANWLAQQEDLIAIRPKSPDERPITMTVDQARMVFWFTMVLVPALLFGNAFRVWWRKR